MLSHGATPSFLEFRNEDDEIVASLSTSGNIDTAGSISIMGTTSIQQSLEKVLINGNTSETNQIDLLSSAIHMYTGASAFSFNFRGSSTKSLNSIMSIGQSITSVIFITNTTSYSLTTVSIDSSLQTVKWFGGSAPTGNSNATDIYTFTIIKTAADTFTVFGSQSKFV